MTTEETKEVDEKKSKRPNHQGSVSAEDKALSLWLYRFWSKGEFPERVEVWQMFGRNKSTRGEMIFGDNFKANDTKFTNEHANKLANEILEACQDDCDSMNGRSGKEAHYQVSVVDRNRKATPTIRRVGPIYPQRGHVLARPGDLNNEDEDDESTVGSMSLQRMRDALGEIRQDKQRNDFVLGQTVSLLLKRLDSTESQVDRMFERFVAFVDRIEAAADRKAQRDILVAKEKFKLDFWQDNYRLAQSVIVPLFAKKLAAHKKNGEAETTDAGQSAERVLIDKFMSECEQNEKLVLELFGEYEEKDKKLVCIKAGVFSLEQLLLFQRVREGKLEVPALDVLMPESGSEHMITQEQITAAFQKGITPGMIRAVLEVFDLRRKAKQEGENHAAE